MSEWWVNAVSATEAIFTARGEEGESIMGKVREGEQKVIWRVGERGWKGRVTWRKGRQRGEIDEESNRGKGREGRESERGEREESERVSE